MVRTFKDLFTRTINVTVFADGTFDLVNVMCKQHHMICVEPILKRNKNGDIDSTLFTLLCLFVCNRQIFNSWPYVRFWIPLFWTSGRRLLWVNSKPDLVKPYSDLAEAYVDIGFLEISHSLVRHLCRCIWPCIATGLTFPSMCVSVQRYRTCKRKA